MRKILIAVFVCIVLLNNISLAQVVETAQMSGKRDDDLLSLGINFIPPLGWTKRKEEVPVNFFQKTKAFYFLSPDKNALIIIKEPQKISLTMFKGTIGDLSKKITEPEKVIFQNGPCFVFNYNQEDGRVAKQYHFFRNGKAYFIGVVINDSSYDLYFEEVKKAINGYELIS